MSVLSAEDVARLGGRVVEVVGERRSTWRYWNLHAEASRQTAGIRFTTTQGRNAAVHQVVAAAEQASVRLTPSDLAGTTRGISSCRWDVGVPASPINGVHIGRAVGGGGPADPAGRGPIRADRPNGVGRPVWPLLALMSGWVTIRLARSARLSGRVGWWTLWLDLRVRARPPRCQRCVRYGRPCMARDRWWDLRPRLRQPRCSVRTLGLGRRTPRSGSTTTPPDTPHR